MGADATYLVSRSLMNTERHMTCIHPYDVSYHMRMANFTRSSSHARWVAQLVQALSVSTKKVNDQRDKQNTYWNLQFGPHILFTDSVYTIGKYAMIDNLPIPNVQYVDQHAWVSLKNCIAHLFGFSQLVGSLLNHHSSYETTQYPTVTDIGESPAL